ncbi:prepilin-type N-terminal cleavage/methylation domain-containing protein [Patescibacteria group bacterium]|nr:prepilin-type N-terminal cleavage/methylation domain-containing protein [Patescibacteria group bacterium]
MKCIYKTHARNRNQGFGMLEVLVGTAIVSLALIGLVTAFNLYLQAGFANTPKVKAVYLLEEGIEAVRFLRDNGWTSNITSLTTGAQYYLEFTGSTWKSTTTPESIDGVYQRTFRLDDAYRKTSNSDIIASTSPDVKAIDPQAREVIVRVSWGDGNVIEMTTYITNLFE